MSNENIERAWVQIPMPDWLFDAWKDSVKENNSKQSDVLENFVKEYLSAKALYGENQYIVLYAPIRGARGRSALINANLYNDVKRFADDNDTRANRVLMSALLDGLKAEGRIRI